MQTRDDPFTDQRSRVRELGIHIGVYPPGANNAITDVAGIKVGHITLNFDEDPFSVRTGITAIVPCENVWDNRPCAAAYVLNGTGILTGIAEINELGRLATPVVATDTSNVARVYDGVLSYIFKQCPLVRTVLPVVGECDASGLNHPHYRAVTEADVIKSIETAQSGPVPEGSVGAGTGMICYRFKGGVGTASRVIQSESDSYTVGALVVANFGDREDLQVNGVPVGREISGMMPTFQVPEGSVIVVIATDAPLEHRQLMRLAKRGVIGLARTGSIIKNESGDFILAFSTGNIVSHFSEQSIFQGPVLYDHDGVMNSLFKATAEAVEESILNALTRARTTMGRNGNTVYALPLKHLVAVMRQYRRC